jgi:hypothetical protein
VLFDATLQLVFSGALQLPTGANITTAQGDAAELISLGAGNWKCLTFTKISGAPLIGGAPSIGRRAIADISGGDTITTADKGAEIDIITGTGTLAFEAVATLDSGFWCIITNRGTGDVTLNPDGTEQIDGLTSWVLYPGGSILVQCNGSNLSSVLLSAMRKRFNSSGTFVKPGCGSTIRVRAVGAGGSGGSAAAGNAAGGGSGGSSSYPRNLLFSEVAATETVTIGAGGAAVSGTTDGNPGGNTTFGSLVIGYGGLGGLSNGTGTGGAGIYSVGVSSTGGGPLGGAGGGTPIDSTFGGGGGSNPVASGTGIAAAASVYGGGGGGGGNQSTGTAGDGGRSKFGGPGGGGSCDLGTGGAGGVSDFAVGGAGGSNGGAPGNGVGPGAGGGGSENQTSGTGANGAVFVEVF